MKTGKILLGVLAGVAAGALIGVLLAPNSGADTRKKIIRKGEDVTDDLKEKLNGFMEAFSEKFDVVKEKATDIAVNGKAKVEAFKAN
jgi:gas vesicle protein